MLYSGTNTLSGLQIECDHLLIIQNIESQLLGWHGDWHQMGIAPLEQECPLFLGNFYVNYGMLVVNSFGLQNALEKSQVDIGHFFARCHTSATACLSVMKNQLAAKGYLKYAPDSLFVQSSYAVLTLLKARSLDSPSRIILIHVLQLLRPELQSFIDEQKTINLVKETADLLEAVAASPMHTPALYSVFLRALIAAKKTAAPNTTNSKDSPQFDGDPAPVQGAPNSYQGFSSSTAVAGSNSGLGANGNGYQSLNEFQFDGEMGPVVDMTTFPPTMAEQNDQSVTSPMSFDHIFSGGFWDSVLVPGMLFHSS